jgi:Apea-like HEPN
MICTVTPLYSFSSDLSELAIAGGIRISKLDRWDEAEKYFPWDTRDQFDEFVGNHLQVCAPDYLLWYNPVLTRDIWLDDFAALLEGGKWSELGKVFLTATAQLFWLFRLFKPGRLRAGETFVIQFQRQDEYWETISSGRAATTSVDYQRLALKSVPYEFNSSELPFFDSFKERLLPLLQIAEAVPALKLALNIYGGDNSQELDAISTVTALEALLTKKDEIDGLTYRLSMRTANLLGRDAETRKKIFLETKNFYNLRSRLVHGAQLDEKLLNRLNEIGSLRETLRRVILSVIALLPEDKKLANLPELLDDLAFDDEKRQHVHALADRFFHLSTEQQSPSSVLKAKPN